MIDINSPVPKYYQLKEILKNIIENEKNPGDRIESEHKLAEKFGVHRFTARQAITTLVNEGLLYREHGKGTFIARATKLENNIKQLGMLLPCIMKVGIGPLLMRVVEDVCYKRGYHLIFCNTDNDPEKVNLYTERLIKERIAGILFMPICSESDYNTNNRINAICVRKFVQNNLPVILVDRHLPDDLIGQEVDYVVTDNKKGGYCLTSHLIKLGHKRIGYLGEPICSSSWERVMGYKDALEENNIKFDMTLVKKIGLGYGWDKVGVLTKEFLTMQNRPTAIFAEHDLIARNVMNTLEIEGVRVPDDMAVVGYDDLEFASMLRIPLTTVRQPLDKEGEIAATILIDKIEGHLKNKQQVVLESELIIRESCGAKRKEAVSSGYLYSDRIS